MKKTFFFPNLWLFPTVLRDDTVLGGMKLVLILFDNIINSFS